MPEKTFKLGFANLNEESSFAVAVRESLEQVIADQSDIELIVRDNNLDDNQALKNAEEFRDQGVEMAIFFHINENLGMQIRSILQLSTLLSIDIPIPLAPHFGLNNHQSGEIVGNALAQWIQEHWDGHVNKVLALIDARVLEAIRARSSKTVSTLRSIIPLEDNQILYLDCGNTRAKTYQNILAVLNTWLDYEHIALIGFNAESTFGILDAVRDAGLSPHQVAIVSHAADADILAEIKKPDNSLIATSYFDPAQYGIEIFKLIEMARNGEPLPSTSYVDLELHMR